MYQHITDLNAFHKYFLTTSYTSGQNQSTVRVKCSSKVGKPSNHTSAGPTLPGFWRWLVMLVMPPFLKLLLQFIFATTWTVYELRISWLTDYTKLVIEQICSRHMGVQGHLAPAVPNTPGLATHRSQNPKAERQVVVKPGRSLSQWSQHHEDSGLGSQRQPPKWPKTLPGLCKENVGQRRVGTSRWAVKVKSIYVLQSIMGGALVAQGSPCCWGGSVSSHQGMLCTQDIPPESWNRLESRTQLESLRQWCLHSN